MCGLHSCRIGREHAYFSKHLIVLYRWTESGLLEWMAHCYLLLNVQWCRKRSICWKRIRCRLKQGLTIKIIHSKRTLYMLRWFFRVRATAGTFMSLQFFFASIISTLVSNNHIVDRVCDKRYRYILHSRLAPLIFSLVQTVLILWQKMVELLRPCTSFMLQNHFRFFIN